VGAVAQRQSPARFAAAGLTIGGAGILGLALFLMPDRVAGALQLPGLDTFAYRSGGAAFLGYAAAFVLGWNAAPTKLHILWLEAIVGASATAVAALLALLGGHGSGPVVPLILAGAITIAALAGYQVVGQGPLLPAPTGRRFAPWFIAFLGWGVLAAALFGIGGLALGSTFGSLAGFAGTDDAVYRLAGAATIGILVGSALSLRSQDWDLVRLPVMLGFVTNVLSLVGGIVVIASGNAPIMLWLIAAAALFNIVGLGLALAGRR
jgi:hypothetical protein